MTRLSNNSQYMCHKRMEIFTSLLRQTIQVWSLQIASEELMEAIMSSILRFTKDPVKNSSQHMQIKLPLLPTSKREIIAQALHLK